MIRKTIDVAVVKDLANKELLNSPDNELGNRQGIIYMIENILMASGNYKGFSYLNDKDMLKSTHGTTLGIIDGSFENTDHTRVYYF